MSATEARPLPAGRLMSIDALRGFDMFWIVGGGGAVQALLRLFKNPIPEPIQTQFEHVEWIGFAAWDLIMPLFLFIVGTSMAFSYAHRAEKGQSLKSIYLHMLKRFVILFILGMVAQGNLLSFDISKLHLYSNTLQAIACGYVVATVALLHLNKVGQGIVTVGLLLLFWLLMMCVPVPGHGAGILEPHTNLAMYVDETILGHFRDGTTYTWILSSITFAATVLLGVMSGHVLRSKLTPRSKVLALFVAGVGGLVLGQIWGIWFPIIKHIWTSSFVLFAAGWSFLLLAFFYLVIDVLGYRKWAFGFIVIGMNAIFAYFAGEFVTAGSVAGLFTDTRVRDMPAAAGFALTAGVFAVFWLILYAMYRRRIFIKI